MSNPLKYTYFQGKRAHLGVCGSVAAYKAIEIMRLLQKTGVGVSVTLTPSAMRFITPLNFQSLDAQVVYTDMFEPEDGQPFGHLTPGVVADAFLIAPATASTLARLAAGMADEMLAAQALAYTKPLLLAPAMNPRMWDNQATRENVKKLRERGHTFVFPTGGRVACGEDGQGKLADVWDIYVAGLKALAPDDLVGQTVLVTLGPTREVWDGVRCWTNLSTGKMGSAIAEAAYLRGARVIAVAGPGVPRLPVEVERYDVSSAREMLQVAERFWPETTTGVFTAAVADFYPVSQGGGKFKKQGAGDSISIEMRSNPDILATLAAKKTSKQRVIGFAAETSDLERHVADKLKRKNANMIVGNLIGVDNSGFAGGNNTCFILDESGRSEAWPPMSKEDCAWRIFDWLLTL